MLSAGPTTEQGSGKMYDEEWTVDFGDKEVFVKLIKHGVAGSGLQPVFEVFAGTDWDGFEIPVSEEEEEAAIKYIKKNYSYVVYLDW